MRCSDRSLVGSSVVCGAFTRPDGNNEFHTQSAIADPKPSVADEDCKTLQYSQKSLTVLVLDPENTAAAAGRSTRFPKSQRNSLPSHYQNNPPQNPWKPGLELVDKYPKSASKYIDSHDRSDGRLGGGAGA